MHPEHMPVTLIDSARLPVEKREDLGMRMIARQYWSWVICFVLLTAIPAFCRAESDVATEWKRKLSAQLTAHKRFPPDAVGQTGEAMVKFALDRSGKLISNVLVKSSGIPQFDAAALAMVENSQPFPPAPPEISDLTFTLPVIFARRQFDGKPDDDIGRDDPIVQEQTKLNAKMRSICRGC
jgi:protein TonB